MSALKAHPDEGPARRADTRSVLLGLLPSLGPVSAEEVQRALAARGFESSLSSVYTSLGALERTGLVRSFRGTGRTTLFVREGRAGVYLSCRNCGYLEGLALPSAFVEALAARSAAHGWRLLEPHVALFGLCEGCRGNS